MLSRNRMASQDVERPARGISGGDAGADSHPRLTAYFDAECGPCTDIARWLELLDWRRQLRLVALQDAALGVADAPPVEMLRATMHVRDERGDWTTGAAGCLQIARRIPLLWTIALVGRLPRALPLLEHGYALLARNRHRIGVLVGAAACTAEKP
ncbi:MAG: thiol-disulfide oxidoreductase DCC family protein [Chloroflexota bacterium]